MSEEKMSEEKTNINRPKSSRKKRSRLRRFRRRLSIAAVTMTAAVYLLISLKYSDRFLPNTVIGGISVSGMTVSDVKAEISDGVSQYELVLEERGGREEMIYGRNIELRPVFDERLEQILRSQNPLLWGFHWMKGKEYQQNCMVEFDPERLQNAIDALECLKPGQITEPVNASISYVNGAGLQIVPEASGNSPIPERLSEEVKKAVLGLQNRLSLDEADIYRKPEVTSDDSGLLARKEALKPYADVTVTYHFGSRSEILDGNTIFQWLLYEEGGTVSIDQTKAEEYVQELAGKYNTAYCAKQLKTSYGPTVTITRGSYGWMIDKKSEVRALTEIIQSGESQEREPVYLQTAASHDGPDYGNTYVEMNLTAQHLYYYIDGKLLIETDFVSGNESKGWSTPDGAYELTYKQRNAVLKGKNYNTPVTYWMPFNGNIGMHDGYWRTSFGGTIYKNNGSHGCINLPPAVAKMVYENIEAGVPVLCYHLKDTESNKATSVPSQKDTAKNGKKTTEKQPEKEAGASPSESVTGAENGAEWGQETQIVPETQAVSEPSAPQTTPEPSASEAQTAPEPEGGPQEAAPSDRTDNRQVSPVTVEPPEPSDQNGPGRAVQNGEEQGAENMAPR